MRPMRVFSGLTLSIMVVLLLFLAVPVYAGGWLTDASGNKIFYPDDIDKNTFTWTGSYKEGYADGFGTLKVFYENGSLTASYQGTFVMGKLNGQGLCHEPAVNGYIGATEMDFASMDYAGEFKDGLMHGKGVMTWGNGAVFAGNWVNGNRNGNGVYQGPAGRFEGYWYSDDKAKGSGTLYDNSRYEGEWESGYIKVNQGPGSHNGGPYCAGLYLTCNGNGTIYYVNGDKYQGEWASTIDGKKLERSGKGVFIQVSGDRYEGEYTQDKRSGKGTLYLANGKQYIGEWKKDQFDGVGTYRWKDGSEYHGDFAHGNMHGDGQYSENGKILYSGLYFDDQRFSGTIDEWWARDRKEHPDNPRPFGPLGGYFMGRKLY